MNNRRRRRLSGRAPGHTSGAELSAALAPFSRPVPVAPFDLPAALDVREEFVGQLYHHRMAFTPSARAALLKLLDVDEAKADEALEWLADELRWPFLELLGHACGQTHPQLIAALRALARLDPHQATPDLPANLLRAISASERHRQRGNLLPDGIRPRPEDLACDASTAIQGWERPANTADVVQLAAALNRAVRRRVPGNWEQLARRKRWEPLRDGAVDCCCRLWVDQLGRPARVTKALHALTVQVLALVDPSFPRSPSIKTLESVRQRIKQALARRR